MSETWQSCCGIPEASHVYKVYQQPCHHVPADPNIQPICHPSDAMALCDILPSSPEGTTQAQPSWVKSHVPWQQNQFKMLSKNWGCWFPLQAFFCTPYAQVLDGLLFAWESLDKVFVWSGCTSSSSNALAIYATRPPCVYIQLLRALCVFNSPMNSGMFGMSTCSAVKLSTLVFLSKMLESDHSNRYLSH